MKMRVLGQAALAGALLLGGALASRAAVLDADLTRKINHELAMYPNGTIWDVVTFHVAEGQVELNGYVTQPYKKSDLERLVRRVPGVAGLKDNVKVLPLSEFDNRLRVQIARAIYSDPVLSRYAMMANPPVHVVVDNGRVTLVGCVANEMEKNIAAMRASGTGLSFGPIVNELRIDGR